MQIEHSPFQDQLVRGLSHRMNNLLTLFHGYLGLILEDQQFDPATLAGLTKIQEGARTATKLMERTHALVRPAKVVWRELDLGELVRGLRPALEEICGPKLTLEVEAPDGLPQIWADMGRIKTAILELVRNAAQASARRSGVVRVEVAPGEPGRTPRTAPGALRWVSVRVSDEGMGVSPDLREKIFTPFFSGPRARRDATGLGLTLALSFVQQHGGLLRIKSLAQPTIFEISLPSRSHRP